MSKWTPAPWKVSGVGAVIGRDGEYIASVQPLMATRYNAALIAEAPAMAEELAHLLALIEPALESGVTIPGLATMNRTRALLARLEEK